MIIYSERTITDSDGCLEVVLAPALVPLLLLLPVPVVPVLVLLPVQEPVLEASMVLEV